MHVDRLVHCRTTATTMCTQATMKRSAAIRSHRKIPSVIQVCAHATGQTVDIRLLHSTGSSDVGISSGHESWISSQTNVYDQICYDSMQTNTDNNLAMKCNDRSPPYTPSCLSDDSGEHYYDRLPTPAAAAETKPPANLPQSNCKRELHKELAYKQRM